MSYNNVTMLSLGRVLGIPGEWEALITQGVKDRKSVAQHLLRVSAWCWPTELRTKTKKIMKFLIFLYVLPHGPRIIPELRTESSWFTNF
jgi:hypothetical protein